MLIWDDSVPEPAADPFRRITRWLQSYLERGRKLLGSW